MTRAHAQDAERRLHTGVRAWEKLGKWVNDGVIEINVSEKPRNTMIKSLNAGAVFGLVFSDDTNTYIC